MRIAGMFYLSSTTLLTMKFELKKGNIKKQFNHQVYNVRVLKVGRDGDSYSRIAP
jgi:hypothetical protein